jgi:ribosomal protein L11 methyltransferase
MPFLQLTLPIGAADPEPFEEALLEAGAVSITLEDAGDDPVLEPAPGTTPLWPTVKIKALFEATEDRDEVSRHLKSVELDWPVLQFEVIEDRPWEREWLKDFKPMRFGQRLWVCPAGQRPSSASEPPASSVQPVFLDLDPGLAFGTGTHPTTRLCLEWLDGAQLNEVDVIDYGCGSGILAVAALKLGAKSALAVDIDDQALTATVENAARNKVQNRLQVHPVRSMPMQPVQVLLANILAEPLLQLTEQLASLVLPQGSIVLSGLLESQAAEVASRYEPWFHIAPVFLCDGWARLDGRRRELSHSTTL